MRKGSIYVAMTGHRKPTAFYCFRCKAAGRDPWHSTARGIGEPGCPFEEREARSKAPAFIAPHKLGITKGRRHLPKRVHYNMADLMPAHIPEGDLP